MKLTNEELSLKYEKGMVFYNITNNSIIRYEYLCEFPFHNPVNMGTFDIIINKNSDQPERIHRKFLIDMLNKFSHIKTYDDACIELIKNAEQNFNNIKEIYKPK